MYDMERQQAIDAGERALASLNAARSALAGARGWGVVDILGGGFLSTMLKRGNMARAQDAMQQANWDLQQFRQELGDIYMTLDVGEFLTAMDYICDGFFSDMLVQGRIVEAQRQVAAITEQVEYLLAELMR